MYCVLPGLQMSLNSFQHDLYHEKIINKQHNARIDNGMKLSKSGPYTWFIKYNPDS